jgi:hypothetical protein
VLTERLALLVNLARKDIDMNDKQRKALEAARHELTTLHGLIAADGAAPQETWPIDTSAVVAAIDEAINEVSCTDSRPS